MRRAVHVLIEGSGKSGRLLDAAAAMAGDRAQGRIPTVWAA
jgi:hypothetical protein